jgi:glycosyltransferase involved in cell wall biosynthesis
MPKLSLIIAVYKNIPALSLILRGLQEQSFRDFEVIVAEDNDGFDMANFIKNAQNHYFFTIKHIAQPDLGFQKDKALNKAIAASDTDYLVFIDGDCILHKYFLKAHFENRQEGIALFGRRVMLSEKLTAILYEKYALQDAAFEAQLCEGLKPSQSYYAYQLSLFNLLITASKRIDCALYLPFSPSKIQTTTGIWGCNWSIHKKHLIAVNGFDEDYIKAGVGEDTDIEWRLFQTGIKLKKIKNKAIQYHLHHVENYANTFENEKLMLKKQQEGKVFCDNGLNQYL